MKTISKKSISLKAAQLMAQSANEKAEQLKMFITICIVDESGNVKYFSRMDGSPLIAIDAARKKALTAVGFGLDTGQPWYDFIKDDPILKSGFQSFKDFTLLGGGSAIISDEQLIGAIGISGGHYKQDELCTQAAIDTFNKL